MCRTRTRSFVMVCCWMLVAALPALAVPMVDDPKGFDGIPWGTQLSDLTQFVRIEDAGRLQTYEQSGQPPSIGATPVDSVRFTTFEKKFGRATVRYSGKDTHEKILTYLQATYGPLDRTPGQIAVGPFRVYAWHGFDTEVTLRFESGPDRGIIFIESLTLPEKLVDGTSATVF